MLTVRTYRADELPLILQRGIATARAQLMERDLPAATSPALSQQVVAMFQGALQAPGGTILVVDGADASPGPIAYALVMPQPSNFTGARELIVLDIWVDPALRGRGVGRSLLEQVEQYARSLGCSGLIAQVARHNRASLQMFLGAGFEQERVVVGKPC